MADSVVRLRIDSSEYDNKLRNATTALNRFFDSARQGGQSIANADKSVEDAVRSFGNMAAKAQDARGKLNEMTRAFTEMSMQYKQLTDAEKQSPVGQAMAKSLDQLKGRINETKGQLAEVNKELGNTKTEGSAASGSLSSLTQVLGVGVGKLSAYAAAAGAANVALDVMKDAFFASEKNLDDWNRVVYSSQSVYQGFLTALNTGDISGYLDNINNIVRAAGEAYNALDRLSTMKTIQTPQLVDKQSEIQRMQMMLRTGRYIAPLDGRTSAKGLKDGDVLTKQQQQAIAKNLESAMMEVAGIMRQQVGASTDAINALYKEQALRLGMSNKQFREGTATMEVFEDNLRKAQLYWDFEREHTKKFTATGSAGAAVTTRVRDSAINPYSAYKGWSVFKDDGELFQRIVQEIQNRAGAQNQFYNMAGRAYRGINRAEGITSGSGGGGSKGGKGSGAITNAILSVLPVDELQVATVGTTTSMKELKVRLSRYTAMLDTADTAGEYKTATQGIADTKKAMSLQQTALKMGWSIEDTAAFQEQLDEMAKNIQPVQIPAELKVDGSPSTIAKETADGWKAAADAVNQVSGALAGLEDPSAKIAGIVGQAIANIALGFATATAKDTKLGVFGWIAAIAGGLATMISTISAIKSATAGSYAQGGIVPGNSYSGDRLTANVNSGELILNAAQQNNIASLLQGGGMSNMHLEAVVSGEQLRFVLNNNSRRRSRGEYVTTLMRN